MATRTNITNNSDGFIMLPQPYAGGLPAGKTAIVGDSVATVKAALAGTPFFSSLGITQANGAAATTPHASGLGQLRMLEVANGNNGAGAVTFAGAKVNDQVLNVSATVAGTDQTANFESTISVAGQIQQTGANLSATKLLITLIAKS